MLGKDLFWITRCPHCSLFQIFTPRKETTKRRRKYCSSSNCNARYDVIALGKVNNGREASEVCRDLNEKYHKDQLTKDLLEVPHNKIRSELQNALESHSDTFFVRPTTEGLRSSTKDQEFLEPSSSSGVVSGVEMEKLTLETDWVSGDSRFNNDLYNALLYRKYPVTDQGVVSLQYEGYHFSIYSSGLVVFNIDTSREDYIKQAESMLDWFGTLCNMSNVPVRVSGQELTINVSGDSIIAKKIKETLPVGTKLGMFQPMGHFKLYMSGDEEYRLEASHVSKLIQGVEEILEDKVPNIDFRDRFFFIQTNESETQQQLIQLKTKVDGLETYLGSLTGVQTSLNQNLVQLTRYMDVVDKTQTEVLTNTQDLLASGVIPTQETSNQVSGLIPTPAQVPEELEELIQLEAFLKQRDKAYTTRFIAELFDWTYKKAHTLLKCLFDLNLIKREKEIKKSRGRPAFLYYF